MATNVERAQAIVNALKDGTATAEELNKLAEAFVNLYNTGRGETLDLATLTSDQKARVFLKVMKDFVRNTLINHDTAVMQAAASIAAAGEAAKAEGEASWADEPLV